MAAEKLIEVSITQRQKNHTYNQSFAAMKQAAAFAPEYASILNTAIQMREGYIAFWKPELPTRPLPPLLSMTQFKMHIFWRFIRAWAPSTLTMRFISTPKGTIITTAI